MNLLPEGRARELRQVYFLRLTVVAVIVLSVVLIAHAVLLLPSYLYVRLQVEERAQQLAALTATVTSAEEQEANARIARLSEDAAYLTRLAELPKSSTAVAAVIALPRPGIALYGFTFEQKGEGGATMIVSGRAATREALQSFEQTLKNASYIDHVDLPIGAYAQERNIEFTVTLTGSFTP